MFSYDSSRISSDDQSIQQGSLMNMPQSYENSDHQPLKNIPLIIALDDSSYLLAAVILFAPPRNVTALGHYNVAVRVNETFEIFDDLRPTTYTIDSCVEVCIHSLIYVRAKTGQ